VRKNFEDVLNYSSKVYKKLKKVKLFAKKYVPYISGEKREEKIIKDRQFVEKIHYVKDCCQKIEDAFDSGYNTIKLHVLSIDK